MYGTKPTAATVPLHGWHKPPTLTKFAFTELDGVSVTSYMRAGDWSGNPIAKIAATVLGHSGEMPEEEEHAENYANALAKLLVERRHTLLRPQFDALVAKQREGVEVGINITGQTNIGFIFVEETNRVEVRLWRQTGHVEDWTLPLSSGYSMIDFAVVANCNKDRLL